jgi:hypothetical protein
VLNRIVRCGPEPVWIALAAEMRTPRPARIPVFGLDENPLVAFLDHTQRLACQRLRNLLGILLWAGSERRELACERMFA